MRHLGTFTFNNPELNLEARLLTEWQLPSEDFPHDHTIRINIRLTTRIAKQHLTLKRNQKLRTFSVYSSDRITSGASQMGLSTVRPPMVGAREREVPKSATLAVRESPLRASFGKTELIPPNPK